MNIPIFRAKKINSDEYVFGIPRQDSKGIYEMIINVVEDGVSGVIQRYIEVDTISIHFPDMLDSQGNKIFASLDTEKGKGGDICEYKDWDSSYEDEFLNKGICIYEDLKIVFTNRYEVTMEDLEFKNEVKVVGIQE